MAFGRGREFSIPLPIRTAESGGSLTAKHTRSAGFDRSIKRELKLTKLSGPRALHLNPAEILPV
jgi:hypothetical protein